MNTNLDHDMRTAMTVLLGYAEVLADGALGPLLPDQTHAASLIVTHAQQLFTALERLHPDPPPGPPATPARRCQPAG